jgi:hypothetical protein
VGVTTAAIAMVVAAVRAVSAFLMTVTSMSVERGMIQNVRTHRSVP